MFLAVGQVRKVDQKELELEDYEPPVLRNGYKPKEPLKKKPRPAPKKPQQQDQPALSAYELQRMKNIQENAAKLASLP